MREQLEFSEFTYGYAFTASFMRATRIRGLPIFPSLAKEGAPGGGYDVSIPLEPAVPLLLQFKVPQVMNRQSSLRPRGLALPYYRAHLHCRVSRPGDASQHEMLCRHQEQGELVFYATPRFHRLADLERLFQSCQVVQRSAFILPSDIGPLSNAAHHVAYDSTSDRGWYRSEPRQIAHSISSDSWIAELSNRWQTSHRRWTSADFSRLLHVLVKSASAEHRSSVQPDRIQPVEFAASLESRFGVAAAAAIFARFWLGSELYFVTQPSQVDGGGPQQR